MGLIVCSVLLLCTLCCNASGGTGTSNTTVAPPTVNDIVSGSNEPPEGECCPLNYAETGNGRMCFRVLPRPTGKVKIAKKMCKEDNATLATIKDDKERIYAMLQIGHTDLYNRLDENKDKQIKNGIWINNIRNKGKECMIFNDILSDEWVKCSNTSQGFRPLCMRPKVKAKRCCPKYFTMVDEERKVDTGKKKEVKRLPPRCFIFLNERRSKNESMEACSMLKAKLGRVDEAHKVSNRVIGNFRYIKPDSAWIDLKYSGLGQEDCKYIHEDESEVCATKSIPFVTGYPRSESLATMAVMTADGVENESDEGEPLRLALVLLNKAANSTTKSNATAVNTTSAAKVKHGFICMKPSHAVESGGITSTGPGVAVVVAVVLVAVAVVGALAAAAAAFLLRRRTRARRSEARADAAAAMHTAMAPVQPSAKPAGGQAHAPSCPQSVRHSKLLTLHWWRHPHETPHCNCAHSAKEGKDNVAFVSKHHKQK